MAKPNPTGVIARKKPKGALTDACISYLLTKEVTKALNSSDSSPSDLETDPVMQTEVMMTALRYYCRCNGFGRCFM